MQKERGDLSERFLDFAAAIIKLAIRLNKTTIGRHISGQLTKSGTSAPLDEPTISVTVNINAESLFIILPVTL